MDNVTARHLNLHHLPRAAEHAALGPVSWLPSIFLWALVCSQSWTAPQMMRGQRSEWGVLDEGGAVRNESEPGRLPCLTVNSRPFPSPSCLSCHHGDLLLC